MLVYLNYTSLKKNNSSMLAALETLCFVLYFEPWVHNLKGLYRILSFAGFIFHIALNQNAFTEVEQECYIMREEIDS